MSETYRVTRLTDAGGWKPVDGFEKLDTAITPADFARLSDGRVPPGTYCLMAVENNLNKQSGEGWTVVKPDTNATGSHVRISKEAAEEAIAALERVMAHEIESETDPDISHPADARDELLFGIETAGGDDE